MQCLGEKRSCEKIWPSGVKKKKKSCEMSKPVKEMTDEAILRRLGSLEIEETSKYQLKSCPFLRTAALAM